MGDIFSALKHLTKPHDSSEEYYNGMKTDVVGLEGNNSKNWMSLGNWKTAEYYNDACEALADYFADYGQKLPL